MHEYHETDIISLLLRINKLRSLFDRKIIQGDCFEDIEKIYLEIKELDAQLDAIEYANRKG